MQREITQPETFSVLLDNPQSFSGTEMKLVIGNKNYSSWSLRAWLLLAVNEVPFEEVRIALSTENTSSDIAKYSAAGKVPVLHDDDLVVWDSLAICEYVSERAAVNMFNGEF